ncbi:hypothetical protein NDU88_004318 [Pleurodeles waltl]|uniref:Secreted protein n=1 Tax=Pleurodeles waltl TaxID=8319 RepID=A0AAV7T7S7_PLEWA|nr:hypothetical protein NDU88_004318 [Pleurodeles waltl]
MILLCAWPVRLEERAVFTAARAIVPAHHVRSALGLLLSCCGPSARPYFWHYGPTCSSSLQRSMHTPTRLKHDGSK